MNASLSTRQWPLVAPGVQDRSVWPVVTSLANITHHEADLRGEGEECDGDGIWDVSQWLSRIMRSHSPLIIPDSHGVKSLGHLNIFNLK